MTHLLHFYDTNKEISKHFQDLLYNQLTSSRILNVSAIFYEWNLMLSWGHKNSSFQLDEGRL